MRSAGHDRLSTFWEKGFRYEANHIKLPAMFSYIQFGLFLYCNVHTSIASIKFSVIARFFRFKVQSASNNIKSFLIPKCKFL